MWGGHLFNVDQTEYGSLVVNFYHKRKDFLLG